jgi:type IV secretory pathway component VirB8
MVDYVERRTRYRMLIKLGIIASVIASIQVFVLIFMLMNPALGEFFVTTRNGEQIPVQPLSAPIVTDQYIQSWAGMRARAAFTLDFVKYASEFDSLKPSFTDAGWEQFQDAITNAQIVDQLQNSKMVVTSVVTTTPTITKQGVLMGSYTWRVKVPLLVSFVSASAQAKKQMNVFMTIRRVPVMNVKSGIQIDYFVTAGQ